MQITVLIGMLLFSGLWSTALLANCVIRFAVSGAFPPYHIQTPDTQWGGLAVDLLKELVAVAECQFTLANVPWDRAVQMLENGELDMLSYYTPTAERDRFSVYIGPMAVEQLVLLTHRKWLAELQTIDDLAGFDGIVGKTQGTFHGESLERIATALEQRQHLVRVAHNQSRIGMLATGRVDAVFEDATVAQYLLSSGILDPQQFAVAQRFTSQPVFFALSKASVPTETVERLTLGWQQLRQNRTVEAVYRRYGLDAPSQLTEK
ncbi:transporter substrate-binding domain-containing protein [Aestuariibacter halophilus]|uniref:Transporter substrate-binding domain-containing protein n=1 Tax=Fluctibacter halophilus TaxID=226011 RepID=A0ABS8GBM8_9ALTE|nr:transporter substrate-binding domain-containing protein [Aestuariibacter halophilus]MCC2617824.1 transporter substrate-binding domain-containing protein [Aestuariibacter halophilus]